MSERIQKKSGSLRCTALLKNMTKPDASGSSHNIWKNIQTLDNTLANYLQKINKKVDIFLARTIETLDLLENDSLNTYLKKKSEEESSQIDKKISIMEEKIMKVLEYIEENDKDNETANDWGDEFPAGVSPYSSNPDDSLTLCLNKSNSATEDKLVDEEMDRTTLEKEKLDNEQQISARLEKIEETISCIEKESSKTLLKMEEIFLLMKEIKQNK